MDSLQKIFTEIYDRYHKELYRYISRILSDEELAQDVLQEVFIKILTVKDPRQIETYPRKWFYTVAKNECLRSLMRRKKRDDLLDLDENIELYAQEAPEIRDQRELLDEIMALLDKMGEEHRDIFWLKHESRLKNNEIAEILGISTKTVKRKLDQVLWELQGKIKLSDFQQ